MTTGAATRRRVSLRLQGSYGPRGQRGVVLVMGLLILLVLTLVGVAAMRSATLEEQMAANATFTQQSLQAAESATDKALNLNTLGIAATKTVGDTTAVNVDMLPDSDDDKVTASANVRYLGYGMAPGWELGSGSGGPGFVQHRFEIEGIGRVPAANAEQTVYRGAVAVGPGGN